MRSGTQAFKIETSTKILMACGLFWIFGGGLIAAAVGLQQIVAGNALYGIVSLLIGAAALV